MLYRRTNIWAALDWWTVIIYLLLVVGGWFSIYAATYDYDQISMVDLSGRAGMQMVWILSSVFIGFSLILIDNNWYEVFASWIYVMVILLLIVTIFVAPDIKGSRSWLVMGPVRIQPAEFAKFATALMVAKVMGIQRFEIMDWRNMSIVLGVIFLPLVLVLLQHETGSALVFLAFFLVFYREGMPGGVLFSGFAAILFFVLSLRYSNDMWNMTSIGEFVVLCCIVVFVIGMLYSYRKGRNQTKWFIYITLLVCTGTAVAYLFQTFDLCWAALGLITVLIIYLLVLYVKYRASTYLWIILFAICSVGFSYSVDYMFDEVLEQHQKVRIQVALGMIEDLSGAGYNVNQSKIAIGSGGITGKGYLNGTQTKLKYVPEQDTDFIFCTIGEEQGFIGASAVMLLFLILIVRLSYRASRQRSAFTRVYGYSVACLLFFHVAINIGMVTGLTPVIGIPLPFFSYGGSSLWAFTILLFIFLRLDASRKL